jgi:2-C-methyl-D-erythritol 4-phosphate cytidylyltransferase
MKPFVDAVIVAAGSGSRLGSAMPKAFVSLGGEAMFVHSVRVFEQHPAVRSIILAAPESEVHAADAILSKASLGIERPIQIVAGGDERWQSVRNGVGLTAQEWVLVHDAARPFVSAAVIDALLSKRETYRCAITATPVVDTIRAYAGDQCIETIDRSRLVRVGTPQLFQRASLLGALNQVQAADHPPTDEALLMEEAGIPVGFAWGDSRNFKITTPEDLELAEALYASRGR